MSTRYFIICLNCDKTVSVADRSFRGNALAPDAKKDLPDFIIKHSEHEVKILSEYDLEETE